MSFVCVSEGPLTDHLQGSGGGTVVPRILLVSVGQERDGGGERAEGLSHCFEREDSSDVGSSAF